ncbi:NAD(P)-dependent Metabolic Enzyme [Abortiporus biennis]
MAETSPSIFLFGATGYLGGEFLIHLSRSFPTHPVTALVRNLTPDRLSGLKRLHPEIQVVEGTLDDDSLIQEQVQKHDIIINCASSDHWPSVKSTLDGLEKSSAARPGNPPIYIHVSGCGIVSDNVRGEPVEVLREWSDIGLDLKSCDPTNTHLDSDIPIVEAGTRKENPIRTLILYPSQIYGIGEGVQRSTLWLRFFTTFAKQLGYVGTWGRGYNTMNNVHVKDVVSALGIILKAVLEGKADEGAEGLYFCGSMQRKIAYREWTEVMGNHLHSKGLVKSPGTRPMPNEIVESLGHYGWSLLGGNQAIIPERLTTKFGWVPEESSKVSLLDTIPKAAEIAWLESVP